MSQMLMGNLFGHILIRCVRPIVIPVAILLLLLPMSAGLSALSDFNTGQQAYNLKNNSSIENPSLWEVFDILKSKDNVDLTHSFRPGIPHWEGFPNETVETVFNFSTSGFLAQKFILIGQWGTHVDAPAHFHQEKRIKYRYY